MPSKPFRMSPEVRSQIIAGIRAGGYAHVAAEAWGMSKEYFDDWMRRGREPKAREPHRSFAREVALAHAQARLRAEMKIFEGDPKVWLVHGPGRETDESPGWSVLVKPAELSPHGRNVLLDPEWMRLFHVVTQALAAYPEAGLEVAQALAKLGIQTTI